MPLALTVALAAANPAVNAITLDQSRELFNHGQAAYRSGNFKEAIEDFLAADRLNPSPVLMFDVAQAYEKSGELGKAIEFYEAYLSRAPTADDRGAIVTLIKNLRSRQPAVGPVVVVNTEPPPAPLVAASTPPPAAPSASFTEVEHHEFHPRPLAIGLGALAVVAAGFAIAGAVEVANFQSTRNAVQQGKTPTVSYASAESQASAAQSWGITAIALTVLAAGGVTGAIVTW